MVHALLYLFIMHSVQGPNVQAGTFLTIKRSVRAKLWRCMKKLKLRSGREEVDDWEERSQRAARTSMKKQFSNE
jgi:hypothetical protein